MTKYYIKFTGDYSKLKDLGYTFQKLYAMNYMQWCKNGTRIWKKGAEVTVDELTNYEGEFLKLVLEYRETKRTQKWIGNCAVYYVNAETKKVSFDARDEYIAQTKAFNEHYDMLEAKFPDAETSKCWELGKEAGIPAPTFPWQERLFHIDDLEPLQELLTLGWAELKEYN